MHTTYGTSNIERQLAISALAAAASHEVFAYTAIEALTAMRWHYPTHVSMVSTQKLLFFILRQVHN
jgi:hypothetical protein